MESYLHLSVVQWDCGNRAAFQEHKFYEWHMTKTILYGQKGVMCDHALCQRILLLSGIEQLVSESTWSAMTAHFPTASVTQPNTNVQLSLVLLQKKKFTLQKLFYQVLIMAY